MRNILTNPAGYGNIKSGGDHMAQTKEERWKKQNELHKLAGYPSQKKYNKEYKKKMYECRFYIKNEHKDALQEIANAQGVALSRLFINAVEEKYGIKLRENS